MTTIIDDPTSWDNRKGEEVASTGNTERISRLKFEVCDRLHGAQDGWRDFP
jgi:hypothetical protein